MFLLEVGKDCQNGIELVFMMDSMIFDHSWSAQQWKEELENPDNSAYIISLDVEMLHPVGFITLSRSFENIDLTKIGIIKEYQRSGYGSKALQLLISMIQSQNIHNIFIEVAVTNKNAIHLYSKAGFHRISTRKRYYQGKIDAMILQKEL